MTPTLVEAGCTGGRGVRGGSEAGYPRGKGIRRALHVAMTGLPGDAALYHELSAMNGPNTLVRADGTESCSAARIRAALSAAGWRITSFDEGQGATLADLGNGATGVRIPTTLVNYTATKGGLKLRGDGSVITGGADRGLAGQAMYATQVWPREAVAVRPLTITGLIAGALAGWLLAAAFGYRMRGSARPRRWVATALSTVALAAAAVPVYVHYRDTYQVMTYAHGSPYPYIVYGPSDELPVLTCTVIGLIAVVAALVAVRARREPAPIAVTG